MISSSLEEYLKTIYVLKKQGQDIKVTTIANRMNCTKPSVNKAIKNLKANEMLDYEAYGEIRLANKGEVHVIMGPNGAGKSTTASVIFNSPEYKKVSG